MLPSGTSFNNLRATVKDRKPRNWAKTRLARRNLAVVMEDVSNGAFVKLQELTPASSFDGAGATDRSAFWVNTHDRQFALGQEKAREIETRLDRKRKRWTLVENVPWKQRNMNDPGQWREGGDDERHFAQKNDGIGFVLDGWGGEPPDPTELYVKICPFSGAALDGAANILLLGDPAARLRGVNAAEIYIPKSVVDGLRKGTYPFGKRASVALRNAVGDGHYVRCPEGGQMTTTEFWKKAHWGAVTWTEWKMARWRNITALDLCLVLTDTRTTTQDLEAWQYAVVPFGEHAFVTTAEEKPEAFNRLVNAEE